MCRSCVLELDDQFVEFYEVVKTLEGEAQDLVTSIVEVHDHDNDEEIEEAVKMKEKWIHKNDKKIKKLYERLLLIREHVKVLL